LVDVIFIAEYVSVFLLQTMPCALGMTIIKDRFHVTEMFPNVEKIFDGYNRSPSN